MHNFAFCIDKVRLKEVQCFYKYNKESIYMSRMLRSFLPVGQGAFYLERFETKKGRINVVYDCGSLTNVKLVEEEIKSNFDEKEEIEIVFISHVDQDHVNGLEFLLTHCNVKNIVFPYTKKADRILLSLSYFCENGSPSDTDFTYEFINDPLSALQKAESNARLWEVHENNEYISRDDTIQQNHTLSSGENSSEILLGTEFFSEAKWEYVPFNFRENERREQFISELENNLTEIGFPLNSDEINFNNILKHWKDPEVQKAIKDAYKKVEGRLNTNSMTLFSGVRNKNLHQWKIPYCHKCYCCHACPDCYDCCIKKNGCLYTGDYEANGKSKWTDLQTAYSKYWDYIGCVQIPHHGSYKNYNQNFALLDAYFVISAGLKNRFRHPNGSVIKDLLFKDKHPLIVTEQRNSEVILKINI